MKELFHQCEVDGSKKDLGDLRGRSFYATPSIPPKRRLRRGVGTPGWRSLCSLARAVTFYLFGDLRLRRVAFRVKSVNRVAEGRRDRVRPKKHGSLNRREPQSDLEGSHTIFHSLP